MHKKMYFLIFNNMLSIIYKYIVQISKQDTFRAKSKSKELTDVHIIYDT